MLAKVAGSNQFKIGQGDKTWNELEFVSSAESLAGFGLKIEDGKLNVDFSNAPDQMEKFEALLKSIYIPILLTKNTNFYINGTSGSDVLDTGRGLSADKPFKTIQACVNYVTQNYNIGNYTLTIFCNKVIADSQLILPNYSYNLGTIKIDKDPSCVDSFGLTLEYTPVNANTNADFDAAVKINGGKWTITSCKFIYSNENKPVSPVTNHFVIFTSENTNVTLISCDFTLKRYNSYSSYTATILCAQGTVTISNRNRMHLPKIENAKIDSCAITSTTTGYIGYPAWKNADSSNLLKIDGVCQITANINGGYFGINGANLPDIDTSELEITGQYSAQVVNGGKVNVYGKGESYFGNKPIKVDTATYSWYK